MITKRGYIEFDKAVNRFERKMIKEMKRIVAETAELFVAQLKALAPVSEIDGGNLRRSIGVEYEKGGLRAIITVGASYALYVNYGTGIHAVGGDGRKTPWIYYSEKLGRFVFTRGMRPQPFWEPSLEVAARHFAREMNKLG